MSLGRAEMPSFSTLNLDGSSSPPPALPPPSRSTPAICYDDCDDELHCSDCGKCYVLCHEHSGCDCNEEDGLEIDFHCAVCCCGRSLEYADCMLRSLLSPAEYHTASHKYLWLLSYCSHSQSIIQCDMTYIEMMSLKTIIKIDKIRYFSPIYVLCVLSHFWPFIKANLSLENFNKNLGFGQPPPLVGPNAKNFRKWNLQAPLTFQIWENWIFYNMSMK